MEYWVPEAAAKLGLQFMKSKIPHAPTSVIMDFLRNMNKVFSIHIVFVLARL